MVNLFRHNIPAATLLQLLIEAGLFFCAVFIAVKLHRHAATLTESAILAPAVVFAVLMVCVNGAFGLYRRDQQLDFVNFVARSIVALFVGFVVAYVAFGAFPYGSIFQDVLWFTVLYALAGVVLVHEVLLLPLTRAVFPHRILVVGTGPEARAVEQCLADANQPNLRLMGFYALEQSAPPLPSRRTGSSRAAGRSTRRRGSSASTKSSWRSANSAAACCRSSSSSAAGSPACA